MRYMNKFERRANDNAHNHGGNDNTNRRTMPTFDAWKSDRAQRRERQERDEQTLMLEQVADAARMVC